ncbi:SRPBCC domain-containing protein [Propionibacteriaceae bacterium Y1923]
MPLLTAAAEQGTVRLTWELPHDPRSVWQHLTDVDRLTEWLGQLRFGSFTVGDELVIDHGEGYLCRSIVHVADEPRELAMTWHFPDEPASRLSINLDPPGRLQLEHTALGDLGGSYLPGWITHLTFLEASLRGEPIPLSAFWGVHATHERLTAPWLGS